MKIALESSEDTRFQMAPMIDMVFLLVIFFMCASHMSSSQSLDIAIPNASKGVIPKERPDRWTVNVTADGAVSSGNIAVSVEQLQRLVAERVKEDANLKVYLRADARTPHKKVKEVMRAMAAAGVDEFIFGVYSPGEEGAS